MDQVHQVILSVLVTKDTSNKVFYYIDPWGETLAYIAWVIRAYYRLTIQVTSFQSIFGRDMIFNLMLVIDWQVITAGKHRQVYIDNV